MVLLAKGLTKSGVVLRVLKATLPTTFNILGIQLSVVLTGTMVSETIFDLPGMGSLLFESIQGRDYPVVQGVVIYSMIVYLLVTLVIDQLNQYLDPRMDGVTHEEI
jgi:peptide/nickel transport system permease protein